MHHSPARWPQLRDPWKLSPAYQPANPSSATTWAPQLASPGSDPTYQQQDNTSYKTPWTLPPATLGSSTTQHQFGNALNPTASRVRNEPH